MTWRSVVGRWVVRVARLGRGWVASGISEAYVSLQGLSLFSSFSLLTLLLLEVSGFRHHNLETVTFLLADYWEVE